MQVTFLTRDGVKLTVPASKLVSSQYVSELISKTRHNNQLELDLSNKYSSNTIKLYLAVVSGDDNDDGLNTSTTIKHARDLIDCFELEGYMADDRFLRYCLLQAYRLWSDFYPLIPQLTDERLIYLHSPYEFLPEDYLTRPAFLAAWIAINHNKEVVLNGKEVYYSTLDFHDAAKSQPKDLACYHLVNGDRVGKIHERGWYAVVDAVVDAVATAATAVSSPTDAAVSHATVRLTNLTFGQLEYQANYIRESSLLRNASDYMFSVKRDPHRRLYSRARNPVKFRWIDATYEGQQEAWYANGQLEYRKCYINGKLEGLCEYWYPPSQDGKAQIKSRCFYDEGEIDGVYQSWYANGQCQERTAYDLGKFDGVRECWKENGKLCWRRLYVDDKLVIDPSSLEDEL